MSEEPPTITSLNQKPGHLTEKEQQDLKWLKVLLETNDWFEYYDILNDFPHLASHPILASKHRSMKRSCDTDTKLMDEMCGC